MHFIGALDNAVIALAIPKAQNKRLFPSLVQAWPNNRYLISDQILPRTNFFFLGKHLKELRIPDIYDNTSLKTHATSAARTLIYRFTFKVYIRKYPTNPGKKTES